MRIRRQHVAGLRDPAALRILPVAAVEDPGGFQAGPVDVMEAAGIDDDAVRLRTRDVERVHAAMRAEGMLRNAGAEGVGFQRALAAQQLERGQVHGEVQHTFLGADRAAAVGHLVEIDLGAKPHASAMASAFPHFQHVRLLISTCSLHGIVGRPQGEQAPSREETEAMTARKMRLGLSIRGHGYHPAAWRHPDVPADGTLHVEHYVQSAQTAERGKLDMIFFADGAGIRQGDTPRGSLARPGRDLVELEPMTLLPALAMVTKHVGLVTTASTTYNEPYNLARKFATLDLISKGRAGWNVVASWSELEAQNFGLETTLDYDTRYARSAEFVEVVKGLWDGWDDGALLFDKASGRSFADAKMHVRNYQGRFFKVRGPLNVAGMPQGHPVIVQAGASEQGRELGAATAEVIYAISGSLEGARAS